MKAYADADRTDVQPEGTALSKGVVVLPLRE